MDALSQVTVPKISIIIRKSYGQGMYSLCGPGAGPDFVVAWPSAEISFLDPFVAVDVAYGTLPADEYQKLKNQMIQEAGPGPAAGRFFLQDIIDPRQTRNYLINILDIIADREGVAWVNICWLTGRSNFDDLLPIWGIIRNVIIR
ncbi:MAG: hypothetical protein MZW92_17830 [Comamonadaceae bacterium]|nr:hypothetical protein [Comamonadaceae bacterium]